MSKRVNANLHINNKDWAEKGHVGFKKGNPGKPKGALTEFTCLKDAFINAFKRIGGEEALVEFGNSYFGRKEFLKMVAKMLPNDVQISGIEGQALIPPIIKVELIQSNDGSIRPTENKESSPATTDTNT